MNEIMKFFLLFGMLGVFAIQGMEKPSSQSQKVIPSLKKISADNAVKNIFSLQQFQKSVSRIPEDMHCELVKAAIRAGNISRDELLTMINTYCRRKVPPMGNFALKSYVYYKTLDQGTVPFLENITTWLNKNGLDYQVAVTLLQTVKSRDYHKEALSTAIMHGFPNVIEFLLELGEKPSVWVLKDALSLNKPDIIQLLINAGAPIDDQELSVDNQPLYTALRMGNEEIIKMLIKAGASLTKQYRLGTTSFTRSISDNLRRLVEESLALPLDQRGKVEGETDEQYEAKYRELLDRIDKYEKLEKHPSSRSR